MVFNAIVLAAFTLVGAEKSAKVVIPENAEPSTRLAVTELTNYVAKISGVVLPVDAFGSNASRKEGKSSTDAIETIASTGGAVIIGTLKTLGDAAPAAARTALEKAKQYEAAWMGTVDGNLWIVGKELPADLYATYHLLETASANSVPAGSTAFRIPNFLRCSFSARSRRTRGQVATASSPSAMRI